MPSSSSSSYDDEDDDNNYSKTSSSPTYPTAAGSAAGSTAGSVRGGGGGSSSRRSPKAHFYNNRIPPELAQKVRSLQRVERDVKNLAMCTMTFDKLDERDPISMRLRNRKNDRGSDGRRQRNHQRGSPNARRRRQHMVDPSHHRSSNNQFLRGSDRRHRARRSQRKLAAAKIQARVRGRQTRKKYQAQWSERQEATR